MGPFVSYMLQVAVVMTLLYLAYKWLLSTSTFHAVNRVVLLGIYVVSWTLPGLLHVYHFIKASEVVPMLEIGELTPVSMMVSETALAFDWWRILLWIYVAGMSIAAIAAAAGIIRMVSILRSGVRIRRDGYTEVVTDRAPGPFSWGGYIVMRPSDTGDIHGMVTAHECAHLRLRHWLDLLPAQLTAIFQWFSPAAWLMMRELKDVHEYQVDSIVAGNNPAAYQIMLLKMTVGSRFPVLADSLNHSQIKKRLTMMMTKKSSPSRQVAALALPAVAALAVFTLSQPMVARVVENIAAATVGDISSDKINKSDASLQIEGVKGKIIKISPVASADDSNTVADSQADAEGSAETEVSAETAADAAPASESDAKDKKPAIFIDGTLGDLRNIASDEIASMSIIKNDPAYPEGKIIVVSTAAAAKSNEGKLYLIPAVLAEFDGGQKGLMQFITENIKYPAGVKPVDKPVRVIVQFTITEHGEVADARIMKGAPADNNGAAFDAEAVRMVNLTAGHWIPAKNDGVPVASQFTIPITFKNR